VTRIAPERPCAPYHRGVRHAAWFLVLAACGFSSPRPGDDPGGGDADWWDPAYRHRRRIEVTAGLVRPDKGYAGYTVRLAPLDAAALTGLAASCDDLRVVAFDGERWLERPRHLLGCGTAEADLRFALPVDLTDGATWREAYLYYDRDAPPAPPAATGTAVYSWWDDASADLSSACQRGRMDAWNGTSHRDSIAWNAAGEYRFDTGDDGQESLRRPVDERDVLVEAEWMHTGCYSTNMQSAVCARVQIAAGTGAMESADHYYCTSRAQNPTCSFAEQDKYDGDILKTDNEIIALQGKTDPPPIVEDQWRKQAIAVFGAGPTQLRFWDADASWPALAAPPASALQATGEDAQSYAGRGAAGVMISQDIGRFRNLVIRRYVEPEPTVAVQDEEQAP
jgi:hypothetical protein